MTDNTAPVMLGQRIRLIQMGKDPNPIDPGTEGEVTMVTDCTRFDGTWHIGVNWENGRTLSLIAPADKFEVLGPFPSTAIVA
ncbi:hypothetical protein SAMN03159338_1523 [Sphingomonas sp. NFR04]|uniref:DUF4314 domain-containing protein n=1 Tax=Sphingomonas sp. NFR04 TaxID=1566283 RepID=UPI0008EEDD41|nr:DUF4314 domain-containing protein [Sphingomonas sp. NFR04]SFJ48444.1 hypothetical protein SAMN03159338_1523 [Sphingomonas sp. NFR04]